MAWQKTSIARMEQKQAQSQKRVMVAAQFHDKYKKKRNTWKAKVTENPKSHFSQTKNIKLYRATRDRLNYKQRHSKPHIKKTVQKYTKYNAHKYAE